MLYWMHGNFESSDCWQKGRRGCRKFKVGDHLRHLDRYMAVHLLWMCNRPSLVGAQIPITLPQSVGILPHQARRFMITPSHVPDDETLQVACVYTRLRGPGKCDVRRTDCSSTWLQSRFSWNADVKAKASRAIESPGSSIAELCSSVSGGDTTGSKALYASFSNEASPPKHFYEDYKNAVRPQTCCKLLQSLSVLCRCRVAKLPYSLRTQLLCSQCRHRCLPCSVAAMVTATLISPQTRHRKPHQDPWSAHLKSLFIYNLLQLINHRAGWILDQAMTCSIQPAIAATKLEFVSRRQCLPSQTKHRYNFIPILSWQQMLSPALLVFWSSLCLCHPGRL
jgi:hypothetical protein